MQSSQKLRLSGGESVWFPKPRCAATSSGSIWRSCAPSGVIASRRSRSELSGERLGDTGPGLTGRIGGRWYGCYGAARCPVHDDRDPSLSIRDGERSVLVKCHAGCNPSDIMAALHRDRRWRDIREPRREKAEPKRSAEDTRRYLLPIWRECRLISGTPAERYLRGRGIALDLPPSLRFHPALKHTDIGGLLPCMRGESAPSRPVPRHRYRRFDRAQHRRAAWAARDHDRPRGHRGGHLGDDVGGARPRDELRAGHRGMARGCARPGQAGDRPHRPRWARSPPVANSPVPRGSRCRCRE